MPKKNHLITKENKLYQDVRHLIEKARTQVAKQINSIGVMLYWHIGYRINADILTFKRSKYGDQIIDKLANQLTQRYGLSYSRRNLFRMIQFAKMFANKEIVASLMSQLKWTHFVRLITINDKLKREFYAEICRIERWSVRELNKKIDSMLYERTAIAKKPEKVIEHELTKLRKTNTVEPDLVVLDPYIFDYIGSREFLSENTLEDAILSDIQKFLLSMGNGFAFLERQKVIEIDGEHHRIDLLMYHRRLRSIVIIELKLGKFNARDKGQVELYLRWLEKHEMQPGENRPIGIIMCSEKSDEYVELLRLEGSGIKVSRFLTELPPKEILKERLHEAIEKAREQFGNKKLRDKYK